MTEEVFEYLMRPRETAKLIRQKREKRMELICSLGAKAIRYDLDKVQTTPGDRMSDIMAEVSELDDEIRELKERLRSERRELSEWFAELEETDAKMMRLRYLDGVTWEVISKATHRSERTNFRRHKEITDNKMWF
jgi:seryl-tRNA synthetase